MTSQPRPRTKVFISYSHKDKKWLERLRVHLAPLNKPTDLWDDGRIEPGDKWREEIRDALDTTRVAVLLVSSDFLASEFITTEELPPLLESAHADNTGILIINAAPSMIGQDKWLSQYQAVNDPEWPLVRVRKFKQEAVFLKTATLVKVWFEHGAPPPGGAPPLSDLPPGPAAEPEAILFTSQSYKTLFDTHTQRTREALLPMHYQALVASPLVGSALTLAACFMLYTGRHQAAGVLMLMVAVPLFVLSSLLLRHVLSARRDIESSEVFKRKFDWRSDSWADEWRDNFLAAMELLRRGVLNR